MNNADSPNNMNDPEDESRGGWTEIRIQTSSEGIEVLTAALMDIGITGMVIRDRKDFKDFLERRDGSWDYYDDDLNGLRDCQTSATVYLPDDTNGAEALTLMKAQLSKLRQADRDKLFGSLEYELCGVREEDWANNWKKYFKPLKVGEKLLIKPSWENTDDAGSRTVIEIDPASSFGTGQHDTTQLCLELLEKNVKNGDRLLDLGCGSGILSVAALKLGAQQVFAVDIEENAVSAAYENALKNGAAKSGQYLTGCGDIVSDDLLRRRIGTDYDIVCANIVADVLIAMSGFFGGFLKSSGGLIVSGIIEKRLDEVVSTIQSLGFVLSEQRLKGGWAACSFTRV